MRFSLDWLRSYVNLSQGPDEIAVALAESGFPVDSVEPWGADHSLDVDVMANRPDCMCHQGLARELAARLRLPLSLPLVQPDRGSNQAADLAAVEIQAPELCPRYSALVITGVQVRPSPDWLQDRLASIGQRPINNIVDVTNFVLHEMGQPLHSFDLDRLAEARIVVRQARPGETLRTLDGQDRTLQTDYLVIADATRPVALAGVMGGGDTEISEGTSNVLLESAHFSPDSIRVTARSVGLHTEASHRFERGSDPGNTLQAALRAAALIVDTGGGEIAAGDLDIQPRPLPGRDISLSLARLATFLGTEVEAEAAAAFLVGLGFQVGSPEWSGGDTILDVTVPSWRGDVEQEVDVIEEVARMYGYDKIPTTLPVFNTEPTSTPRPAAGLDRARLFMAAAGFYEAINYPMSSLAAQEPFAALNGGDTFVSLDNPLNSQMDTMRISLIPGLLANVVHNQNRGQENLKLFEVGHVFAESKTASKTDPAGLPRERPMLGAILGGTRHAPHWDRRPEPADFFDVKGIVQELGRRVLGTGFKIGAPDGNGKPFLAPDQQGLVLGNDAAVGYLGRLHPSLAERYELREMIYVLEVDLSDAPPVPQGIGHQALPRHPAVERDLALLVDETVPFSALETVIDETSGDYLESLSLFDRYGGKPIPDGKVSLAVRLVFRHPDRTLKAEDVQENLSRMVKRLEKDLGASLRDF